MSQKVSLRLNVKLPSAGLNGQLQRADERAIDRVHEKVTPRDANLDSGRSTPVSDRQQTPNSPAVSDQFSTKVCDLS